jgi:hypothetical protein
MKLGIFQILPHQLIQFDYKQIQTKIELFKKYPNNILVIDPRLDELSIVRYLSQFVSSTPTTLKDFIRMIPEDICVLHKINGRYLLVGALVGFPNRWRPSEKIGTSIDFIHHPVPDFDSRKVEQFFELMREGKMYRRSNWGVVETPDLYLPYDKQGTELYFREEIQTLIKVKDHIIFLIYTKISPVIDKIKLTKLINETNEPMRKYKGINQRILSKL